MTLSDFEWLSEIFNDNEILNVSALEALRNALYKFKTYLLTYEASRGLSATAELLVKRFGIFLHASNKSSEVGLSAAALMAFLAVWSARSWWGIPQWPGISTIVLSTFMSQSVRRYRAVQNQTVLKVVTLVYDDVERRSIQTVSKTGVLHVTAFKYSLHNFSEIILHLSNNVHFL